MQARFFTAIAVMVLFPPVALLLGGLPVAPRFGLPPAYEYQTGEPFSPLGTTLLCLTAVALIPSLVALLAGRRSEPTLSVKAPISGLPKRGWAGLGLLGLGVAAGIFLPASLGAPAALTGLTLALDADTCRRGGRSLVLTNRWYFLALYLTGAIVGWGAEYLDRFVAVWHLTAARGAWTYLADVTLPSAALLPAAVAARQWLMALCPSGKTPPPPAWPLGNEARAILLFLVAAVGLMAGPLWPQTLFVVAWGAPVALLVSLQLLWGGNGGGGSGARAAASMGGGLISGGLLAVLLSAGAGWALANPLMSAPPLAGRVLLGFVLFCFYGLVATRMGDWVATAWRGKPAPRRFPIAVKVESK